MGPVNPIGGNGQGSCLLGCSWGQELTVLPIWVSKDVVGRKFVALDCRGAWRDRLLGGLAASGRGRDLTFGLISWQGRHLVMVGYDERWPIAAPAKVGHIGTPGTCGGGDDWVVVP